MKASVKTLARLLTCLLAVFLLAIPFSICVSASDYIDEIQNFTITANLNEDGSINFVYHIDWKVLDDDEFGPLEWVDIGLPNSYASDVAALTDNISTIQASGNSMKIYFTKKYYENEIVSFEYSFKQDHMYQIDKFTEGETVIVFTPAWFDEAEVKNLTIKWNLDQASTWQPDCTMDKEYLIWSTSLKAGQTYTISVTYPNGAFGFDPECEYEDYDSTGWNDNSYYNNSGVEDIFETILGVLFSIVICILVPISIISSLIKGTVGTLSGFDSATEKKIIRTKIEYFDSCPSCGAPRKEGQEECEYCKKSLVKSKEIVEEKDIEHPENYTKKGTWSYGGSSNTFIHVNVINVPAPRSTSTNHRSHWGGGTSSCAHSSCACACVSSCACACACASSGRAGCSIKDFFDEEKHNNKTTVHSYGKTTNH